MSATKSRDFPEERFLGTESGKEVTVQTDIFTSCAFSLKAGEIYIVYADRNNTTDNLTTGMCSGTKPISVAQEEIDMLRAERGKLSTVYGKVGFGRFGRLDPRQLKEFGVNKIRLIGTGSAPEENIESDGRFRFSGVPAGEYRLEVLLPETLMVDGEYNEEIAEELGIKDQRLFTVSGIGCVEKELPIRENGRISGRLLDERGEPIANVEVSALPLGKDGKPVKQEELCSDLDLCVSSKDDGSYMINGLKLGRYLIGVRLEEYVCNDCTDSEYKKTLYPGVANEARAKPVMVGFGQLVERIDLKLTSKFRKREITGIVVFKDGRPAANVTVRYIARTPDLKQNSITFIKTDANGNFALTVFDEHAYMIGAYTDRRDGNEYAAAKAVVIKVRLGKPLEALRLVLDQPVRVDEYSDFDTGKAIRKR